MDVIFVARKMSSIFGIFRIIDEISARQLQNNEARIIVLDYFDQTNDELGYSILVTYISLDRMTHRYQISIRLFSTYA